MGIKGINNIVIDLDDTILHSAKMYDDLIERELYRLGATTEMFSSADKEEFDSRAGEGIFSYEKWSHILANKIGNHVDARRLKFLFDNFVASNSGKYVFSDVYDFLDSYCKQARISILTKGPDDLQSLKIAGLRKHINLKKHFSEIVITQDDKGIAINELCSEKNRLNVFIDDSLMQIDSVRKARPDIVTIWIKRKIRRVNKEKHIDPKDVDFDYRVSDLIEADRILSEIM